jgi:threonylcarbamoyladenosine tRNA methylthiotransferase MtaB
MASSEKVCPHLHVPLQSGDDRILKLMNRNYARRDFLQTVERIGKWLPEPGLTSDVLVGFPGESEAEFKNTYALCREIAFSRLHVFPFSPREGTRAFSMPGRLPAEEIRRRVDELCSLGKMLQQNFASRFVDRPVEVLVESKRDKQTGMLRGYTERYVRAMLDGPDDLKGKLIRAKGVKTNETAVLLTGRA